MTTESRFWSRLRGKLGPGDFVRVENPCDPGTPDVNFCVPVPGDPLPHTEGWMELKFRSRAPRPTTVVLTDKHGLRRAQKLWIRRRVEAGGLVLIAVGIGDFVYFVPGRFAREINDWTLLDFLGPEIPSAKRRSPRLVQKAFKAGLWA